MTDFLGESLVEPIPLLDVRSGGPMAHARARVESAIRLRDACLAPFPRWTHGGLGPLDSLSRRWLRRSASLYRDELESIAEFLGFPGAITLNLSYLFACTTSARLNAAGLPVIRRALDWPFHGLGECVEIAWQSGPAGDFYNVTWPGAVGVLTAMAPGRFSAAINAAPIRRRTASVVGLPYDLVLNVGEALARGGDWPPDHLLRHAFETCASFEDAISLLASEPLARPTLFVVAGVEPGELAVVERREREARVLRGPVAVANDWQTPESGWRARMGHDNNVARRAVMTATESEAEAFDWVKPPVLNNLTRLVVEMTAAGSGEVLARGYEAGSWRKAPVPATQDFRLGGTPMAMLAA